MLQGKLSHQNLGIQAHENHRCDLLIYLTVAEIAGAINWWENVTSNFDKLLETMYGLALYCESPGDNSHRENPTCS